MDVCRAVVVQTIEKSFVKIGAKLVTHSNQLVWDKNFIIENVCA